MGPFQIAFIAVNIIFPTWLWLRTESATKVEWAAWDVTMTRLINASGGANCPVNEIVKKVHELCDKSLRKMGKNETVIFEQDIGNHTYSCEGRKDSLAVKITPSAVTEADPQCELRDARATLLANPSFVFTLKGFVNSMSFDSLMNDRQTIAVSNCRRKLKGSKALNFATSEEFEAAMPAAPNDPLDRKTANRFCWVYDAAPGWESFRQRYPGKSE